MTIVKIKEALKEKGIKYTSKQNKTALLSLLGTVTPSKVGESKPGEH